MLTHVNGLTRSCDEVLTCNTGGEGRRSGLTVTRYSFTSRLLCTNQRSFSRPPPRLHCPHGCNTFAILFIAQCSTPLRPPV